MPLYNSADDYTVCLNRPPPTRFMCKETPRPIGIDIREIKEPQKNWLMKRVHEKKKRNSRKRRNR